LITLIIFGEAYSYNLYKTERQKSHNWSCKATAEIQVHEFATVDTHNCEVHI